MYLDYNGTTPLHPRVATIMKNAIGDGYFTGLFGNPSSVHKEGVAGKRAISKARRNLCKLLDTHVTNVVFNSGGTEADNAAIIASIKCLQNHLESSSSSSEKPHVRVLISEMEHPAIKELKPFIEEMNAEFHFVPVNKFGQVTPDLVKHELDKNSIPVACVSIMLANNEIGTISPIHKICETVLAWSQTNQSFFTPFLHCDAAQAIGKVPVSVTSLGVDFLTLAGHKLYAPKGIGCLICANDRAKDIVRKYNVIHGAAQEDGLRPGTENVLSIIALGEAAAVAIEEMEARVMDSAICTLSFLYSMLCHLNGDSVMEISTDSIPIVEKYVQSQIRLHSKAFKLNGILSYLLHHGLFMKCINKLCDSIRSASKDDSSPIRVPCDVLQSSCPFLPNTLSISLCQVEANTLTAALAKTLSVSAGAACHSDIVEISDTLQAIHCPIEYAMGTIRVSNGCGVSCSECIEGGQLFGREIRGILGERIGKMLVEACEKWYEIGTEGIWLKIDDSQLADTPVEVIQEKEEEEVLSVQTKTVQETESASMSGCPLFPEYASVQLTAYTSGQGCACKLRPQALERALRSIAPFYDPALLVGTNNADDACVYDIGDGRVLVSTVDFFTPVVDDPVDFGRIAASNALSDVYAMNAKPIFALAVCAFPSA
ncbi:Selenophosphate synthetase like protein, partial [Aduncisulcus paluster]